MNLRKGFLVIFLFFAFSCTSKKNEEIILYNLMSNKIENLTLNIKYKDSVIDYKYGFKENYKDFDFRYYLKKDILVDEDVLYYKNKQFIHQNIIFKLYGLGKDNGGVSHPRMYFFNKDFGILANVTYGVPFVFLKDSISLLESEILFKKIIFEINN